MKYRVLQLYEHVPFYFCKRFTTLFDANRLNLASLDGTKEIPASVIEEIDRLLDQGFMQNHRFVRSRIYKQDVPDVDAAHGFYTMLMTLDESLLKLYRAYQLGYLSKTKMKQARRELCGPVAQALESIEVHTDER